MATITEERVPPLRAGDELTREEFLRRLEADPSVKLAELIDGTVYMPFRNAVEHGNMVGGVADWLTTYHAATPSTAGGRSATLLLCDDAPQPDLNLHLLPEYGGASTPVGRYLRGTPELLVEVCTSTASYDLNQKYRLYQSAGIPEYLAVVVFEQEIRWHVLVDGRYQLLAPADADGLYRSRIFPGLWLDGQALLAGNLRQVLDRLQDGLKSAEHQQFVAQLAAKASKR